MYLTIVHRYLPNPWVVVSVSDGRCDEWSSVTGAADPAAPGSATQTTNTNTNNLDFLLENMDFLYFYIG